MCNVNESRYLYMYLYKYYNFTMLVISYFERHCTIWSEK